MSLIVDPLQIQEEMEMWKMRGMEVQMSQHKPFSNKESVRWGQHLVWTTWNQLTTKLIQYCVL